MDHESSTMKLRPGCNNADHEERKDSECEAKSVAVGVAVSRPLEADKMPKRDEEASQSRQYGLPKSDEALLRTQDFHHDNTSMALTRPSFHSSSQRRAPSVPGAFAVDSPFESIGDPEQGAGASVLVQDASSGAAAMATAQEERLAEAKPICYPAEEAEPVYEQGNQRHPARDPLFSRFLLVTILLVAGSVTTVVAVLHAKDETTVANEMESGTHDLGTESSTDTASILDLQMNLPNHTMELLLESIVSGSLTPQHQAYQWIQGDPWLDTYSEARLVQRFALATLYFATAGSNWTHQGGSTVTFPDDAYRGPNVTTAFYTTGRGKEEKRAAFVNITSQGWLSYKTDECEWFSKAMLKGLSTCDGGDSSLYYSCLDVEGNNLVGTIPQEVGLLTNLKSLFLGQSNLQGSIASQVGLLTKLRDLDMGDSSLTGSIPSEIGLLSDTLQNFVLKQNQLTGSFPSQLWRLSRLQQIIVGRNAFSGALPDDIGSHHPKLKLLMVYSNNLEATLPSSLGLMTDLLYIDIPENRFTGTLPSELGNLRNVTRLFLAHNYLSGLIPSELARLPALTKVNLQGNHNLTGPFPPQLRHLNGTLTTLQIQDTSMTGTIPEELCSIKKLRFDCSEILCGCDCPCVRRE